MILQLCFLVFTQMNMSIQKPCTWLFMAALFIIAKTWKQPCPSVQKWKNKLWYIQTIEHYSVLNRNELSSHVKTWKKFKCFLPSERRQSDKTTYSMIPTVWHSRKNYRSNKKIRGHQWSVGREGWVSRTQRIFRTMKPVCSIL